MSNYFLRVIPTMRLYLAYSVIEILTIFLAKLWQGRGGEDNSDEI